MEDRTTYPCTKCKTGVLTIKWFSEATQTLTDYGVEYDVDNWMQIIDKTCQCEYDLSEEEELFELVEKKVNEEYQVWADSQKTDDDLLVNDIEFWLDKEIP